MGGRRLQNYDAEMKSRTFRLFILSGLILAGTLLCSTFWDAWRLGPNMIPLAMTTTVAFGISIAGLIVGFGEVKSVNSLPSTSSLTPGPGLKKALNAS